MAKRTPKKRLKTYAELKRELDRVFSIWVRQRDSDENGIISCCCCATKMPWPKSQAAHYIPRNKLGTRWEPYNVHACCVQCNVFKRGNYPAYAAFIAQRYGADMLVTLMAMARKPLKLNRTDLTALIERYKSTIPEALLAPAFAPQTP